MHLVALLYALFASVFTISKSALEHSEPFFLVGSRMTIAGLILLGYQYIFNRKEFVVKKEDFIKILCFSAICIYLTNAFEFWGLQYLTSFKTCFIYSFSPFVSALLSYFMFKEKLSNKKWLGLVVGFAGFLPILLAAAKEDEGGSIFFFSWAELSVMMAMISSVYGWILLKQLVRDRGCSPTMVNGTGMCLGGLMALAHSYLVETWNPLPIGSVVPFLECTLLLIIISNLICYNLYGFLLKRFSATFMSFAGFTTPLFTAIFGWYFLGETVTMPFYIAAAIVFAGLLLFYQEELREAHKPAVQAAS